MDPDSRRSLSAAHNALSVLVYLTAASALLAVLLQLVLAQLNHLGTGFGRDLIPNFSRLGLVLRALMGGSLLALSAAPAPFVRKPALAGGGLLLSPGPRWLAPVEFDLPSRGHNLPPGRTTPGRSWY